MTKMKLNHFQSDLLIKSVDEDGTFRGYGSVFGVIDQQNEVVAKGAFARSLTEYKKKNAQPALLWQHDPTQPIGAWTNVQEDQNGLVVEGKLALGTQKGREAYELMKMNALNGLSIGYRVLKSRIDAQSKARILTDVQLFEISLVTFPANESAIVNGVKAADEIKTIRDFENFLRDEGGYSAADAKLIASGGYKALHGRRDDGAGLGDLVDEINRTAAILQPT